MGHLDIIKHVYGEKKKRLEVSKISPQQSFNINSIEYFTFNTETNPKQNVFSRWWGTVEPGVMVQLVQPGATFSFIAAEAC